MSIPFYSNLDLNDNRIINLKSPEDDFDCVNVNYLNTRLADLNLVLGELITQNFNDANIYTDEQIQSLRDGLSDNVTSIVEPNIVDNLTTPDNTKMLSANMGVTLATDITDINNRVLNLEFGTTNIYDFSTNIVGLYETKYLYRIMCSFTYNSSLTAEPEFNLAPIIGDSNMILSIKGQYKLNNKLYYISNSNENNTQDTISIQYIDLNTKQIKLFIGDNLATTDDINIEFIIEYYEDN